MPTTANPHTAREAWLNDLAQRMRPLFAKAGSELPKRFRVTMSLTPGKRAIGTCFSDACSRDKVFEILIRLDREDPIEVAGILAHELVHAAVGLDAGHKGPFARVARALGLVGKLTEMHIGDQLRDDVKPLLEAVGPFPHARLDLAGERDGRRSSGPRKQGTRMLKMECQACGLVARMTKKWIDAVGPVHCPEHGEMVPAAP